MKPIDVKADAAIGSGSSSGGESRLEAKSSSSLSGSGETAFGSLISALALTSPSEGEFNPALAELVEQVTRDLQAGEPVDIDGLAARHPTQAEMVRRLLPALRQLATLGPAAEGGKAPSEATAPGAIGQGRRLGDFQLVRELGRGGMGVVFEAIQESLGRRVALKVLPTAAALDSRAMQRFQVEAQAAALLQHPHIVPVYAIGIAEGIPYHAMQLIEGRSLADLMWDLRRHKSPDVPGVMGGAVENSLDPLVACLLSGRFDSTRDEVDSDPGGAGPTAVTRISGSLPATQSSQSAARSIVSSIRSAPYFRAVARLGVQAAEALEYAHGHGIIHRDVKPANLLLDRRGCLWVNDFGLARLPGDSGLTLSGDLLGTLRYMSPEQAAGNRALVDRRTDIYSLGATLYELLALRPAFDGPDPHKILLGIAEKEPAPIRSLNPAAPTDLATVVSKAMAKDPAGRYLSAQHLADDLNRFLEGRPVAARPARPWERAIKWARRRPALTALFLAVQVLAVALVVMSIWSYRRISREAEAARAVAVSETQARAQSQRTSAALALDRGIALAEGRQVGRGLLWMLRALELAPPKAADLRRVAQANLAAWGERAPVPRAVLPFGAPVSTMALSPDGRIIAVGGDDGILSLWDADTGRPLGSARVPQARFSWIKFHPDGRLLATSSTDGRAQLWDLNPLRPRGEPISLAAGVADPVAFHPDGRSILTAGPDGVVRLRSVDTGQPIGPGLNHGDRSLETLRGVGFRPGGDRVLTYGMVGGARLWETATGRPLFAPLANGSKILTVAFSPDGRRLAMAETGAGYGRIGVWDADSGRAVAGSPSFAGGFRCVVFHPDGRTIAAGGQDGLAVLLDAETGQVRRVPMPNSGPVSVIAFSPDRRLLVVGCFDGTVRFFDAATDRPLGAILEDAGPIGRLLFRSDGRGVVTSSRDGAARAWDISSIVPLGRAIPVATVVATAEYSPDGRLLAIDGLDGAARVYETATARLALPPLVHAARVRIARFSPDGRLLATGGDDSMVSLWDVATGLAVGPPMSQPYWALNLRFSPDGRKLLVGTALGVARLWDLDSFRPIGAMLAHPAAFGQEIWNVAFDPSGRVAITGTTMTAGSTATVGFWDAATGRPLAPFARFQESIAQFVVGPAPAGPLYVVEGGRVHALDLGSFRVARAPFGQRIQAIALLPDGRALLAAGSDKTARLWDVAEGRPIGPILEHEDPVHGVAVSRDGATLLTLAGDRLRFWDRATGKPLGPSREHPGLVLKGRPDDRMPLGFSPDGRAAVSVGGAVIHWDLPGSPHDGGVEPARLAESVRALTGMGLDGRGDLAMLDLEDWRRLLARRESREAAPEGPAAADWNDRLAAEAERSGQSYAARWHLDRLVAARPADWGAFARRATARRRGGDGAGAATDGSRARELGPAGLVRAWEANEAFDRATEAQAHGRWDEVSALLRSLLGTVGDDPAVSWRLAEAEARVGRWAEAETQLALAVATLNEACLDSADHLGAWARHATLCVWNGHRDAYRLASRRLLVLAGPRPAPRAAFSVAWHCSIGRGAVDDPMVPVRLVEGALSEATDALRPSLLAGSGAARYRAGRYDEAIALLEEAERLRSGYRPQIQAFLGMANQASGRSAEARRWLDQLHRRSRSTDGDALWNELEIAILEREAEAVVVLDPAFPADPFAP
jgi:eukaryotic-like serine/threonine-protein kinase